MNSSDDRPSKTKHTVVVRSELVNQLAAVHPSLSSKDVDHAIRCLLSFLADSLSKGRRVEVRGFGSFSLHHRKARVAAHPRTGDAIFLPAKSTPHFKPGKSFREAVDKNRKNGLPSLQADRGD